MQKRNALFARGFCLHVGGKFAIGKKCALAFKRLDKYCHMNCKKLFLSLSACLAFCGSSFCNTSQVDLQELIDNAAESKNKTLVLSGRYFVGETLKISTKHSGLKIVGKDDATLSGGKRISGWTRDGKLLKAKIDFFDVEALFVNGQRRNIAHTEDVVYMYSKADKDWKYNGKPLKHIESRAFKMRNEDLAFFEGLTKEQISNSYLDIYEVWYNNKANIIDIVKNPDGETSTVLVNNLLGTPFYKWETAPRFRICNAFKALDKPGEFYFDKTDRTLYYMPMPGEDETNIKAYYPVVTTILDIFGDSPDNPVRDISIENVTFEYGARRPEEGWRQSGQAAVSTRGFIRAEFARSVKISSCEIRHNNCYGIAFHTGSQNCEVLDCHLWDLGAGGIKITDTSSNYVKGGRPEGARPENSDTKNILVRNNIINAYGRFDKAGVGVITMNCADIKIDHNTIFDGYYTGISTGWTWGFGKTRTRNLMITNNKIFKLGHGLLCDMGGIYTLGNSKGSVISGNEIYDVRRHRYGGWGIYNDEGSQGFLITNNYVHNTQEDGYFMHYGENCTVRNNVITDCEISQVGLNPRVITGQKVGNHKLKDGFVFESNIVVFKSPARLLREKMPIPRTAAAFSKNIYWNTDGGVDFAGVSFEDWQKKFGQDKGSLIVNPMLDGETPKNSAYIKIGFKPFSVKKAGVVANMKQHCEQILKDYKFPALENNPPAPPWKKASK